MNVSSRDVGKNLAASDVIHAVLDRAGAPTSRVLFGGTSPSAASTGS
jgi:hypothetical protein